VRSQPGVTGGGAAIGASLAPVGDTDADGYQDLAFTSDEADALGSAHSLAGPFEGNRTIDSSGAHLGPVGVGTIPNLVVGNRDLTADDQDDWVVGSAGHDSWGVVWVLNGAATGTQLEDSAAATLLPDHTAANVSRFGASVLLDDFDSDGAADLLATAPQTRAWDEDSTLAGRAFVFLGPLSGQITTADADVTFAGTGSTLGRTADWGDLTGDGIPDLVLGAEYDAAGSTETEGGLYLFDGSLTAPATLSSSDADHRIGLSSASGDLRRTETSTDLSGDGSPDLVVVAASAASHRVWVLDDPLGVPFVSDSSISVVDEDSWFGAPVGDVNHDGVGDIATGGEGTDQAGYVQLFLGPLDGVSTTEDSAGRVDGLERTSTCDAGPDCENYGSYLGYTIGSVGDLDDDMIDDFAASAPHHSLDSTLHGPGVVYLFFGGE